MRRKGLIALGLVAPACVLGILLPPVPATHAQTSTAGERRVVVLSDLHMGVGRDASGAWHPFEDFRWATELELFLGALEAETAVGTDLILNGDTFELLQGDAARCVYEDVTLGCTEPEALALLERVLVAHTREMAALGAFARVGANQVVLVPGDHDAALLFPSVGRLAVAAFDAPADRWRWPARASGARRTGSFMSSTAIRSRPGRIGSSAGRRRSRRGSVVSTSPVHPGTGSCSRCTTSTRRGIRLSTIWPTTPPVCATC